MLEGISLDLAIESFSFLFVTSLVYKIKLQKMELRVPHMLHIFNIYHENKDSDNCAQVLEEECIRMFGTKYLNDEHDCNVVSMNSLNIHDANDMQSHKLGEAMFDDIFCPPSFDEQIYYDESMPPIYDDYCDDMYALKNNDNHETCHLDLNFQSHDSYFVEFAPTTIHENKFAYVESNKISTLVDPEKNAFYVIVILLNSFMMLLKIIMREEHM